MALYGWGYNGSGQIGIVNRISSENSQTTHRSLSALSESVKKPRIISEDLDEIRWTAAGDAHSILVTSLGEVLTIGRGKEGQLGNGERAYSDVPVHVLALQQCNVSSVVAGSYHSLALTSSGLVYQWGRISGEVDLEEEDNAAGHLPGMRRHRRNEEQTEILNRIIDNSTQRWLSAEDQSEDIEYIGVVAPPAVQGGLVRLEAVHRNCFAPVLVRSLMKRRIVFASAGYAHTCCVSHDGQLFACGYNDHGQLGMGHRRYVPEFNLVAALAKHRVLQVACGQQHTVARVAESADKDGITVVALYSWGSGALGQLGTGQHRRANLYPNRIDEALDDRKSSNSEVIDIACGSNNNIAVTANGLVYGWGHSEYNQQGNSDDRHGSAVLREQFYYYRPRLINGLEGVHVVKATCGGNFTLAISKDARLYSWGWNGYGVLGGGKMRVSPRPELVPGLTGVKQVSAGMKHALAVADLMDGSPLGKPVLELLINDPELANARVAIVGGMPEENSSIFVHRCIIAARCPQLEGNLAAAARRMDSEDTDKVPVAEFELDLHEGLNYDVLMALVVYIYTDRLKLSNERKLSSLGKLALSIGLSRLGALCAREQSWLERKKWFSTKGSVLVELPPSTFMSDMHGLLTSGKHADVQLKFKDADAPTGMITFNVHKALLCRFDYFRAMLCGSFSESHAPREGGNNLPTIDLSGFVTDGLRDPSLFELLLQHVYSGSVNPPMHVASDMSALGGVLTTAQAMGMDNLVVSYERALGIYAVEDENCASELQEFAESYGLLRLARQCKDIYRYSTIDE